MNEFEENGLREEETIFQIDDHEFLPGTDDYYKDIEEEIRAEKELKKQIHDSKKSRSISRRKMG